MLFAQQFIHQALIHSRASLLAGKRWCHIVMDILIHSLVNYFQILNHNLTQTTYIAMKTEQSGRTKLPMVSILVLGKHYHSDGMPSTALTNDVLLYLNPMSQNLRWQNSYREVYKDKVITYM